MRLLFITQTLDERDPVLGFVHEWVYEFAKHVDTLTIVALNVGDYRMPTNVRVVSLGKERGKGKASYLLTLIREVIFNSGSYDSVFVHMNPIYLVLFGLWWKIARKTTVLWYTHKLVDLKLRVATFLANHIASASSESFRIKTKKLNIVGHGIPVDRIESSNHEVHTPYKLISVGRITESKQCEVLVHALNQVHLRGHAVELTYVGAGATQNDSSYKKWLENEVIKLGLDSSIHFAGGLPYNAVSAALSNADCFVSASNTGGLDKAVLEAMAAEIPVVTSNSGLVSTLATHPELMFENRNVEECASKILSTIALSKVEREALGQNLRSIVTTHHSLEGLIPKLIKLLQ